MNEETEGTLMEGTRAGITFSEAQMQAMSRIAAMPKGKSLFCPLCGEKCADGHALTIHYFKTHPGEIAPAAVRLTVNGQECTLLTEPQATLQEALQHHLGLTGAKHMCDRGQCGSCTVILNGRPALSCNLLAADCDGMTVQTVEGIAADPKWRPLIDAYCKWDAMQCGYCTPGFLVTAKCLLDWNPHPTAGDIKKALSGNICICGTYPRHTQAILEAVETMSKGGEI